MNNIGSSIERARSLLRAALDPSMTFNPQPIHLRIEDCCSGKPDHLCHRHYTAALRSADGTFGTQLAYNREAVFSLPRLRACEVRSATSVPRLLAIS